MLQDSLHCVAVLFHCVAGCIAVHVVKTCGECVGNVLAVLCHKNSRSGQGRKLSD